MLSKLYCSSRVFTTNFKKLNNQLYVSRFFSTEQEQNEEIAGNEEDQGLNPDFEEDNTSTQKNQSTNGQSNHPEDISEMPFDEFLKLPYAARQDYHFSRKIIFPSKIETDRFELEKH